jgi:hypothetical protein
MPDSLPHEPWDPRTRIGRCEMELRDGRIIDLTGKTVDEVMAIIRELGITPLDVKETRHYVHIGKQWPMVSEP